MWSQSKCPKDKFIDSFHFPRYEGQLSLNFWSASDNHLFFCEFVFFHMMVFFNFWLLMRKRPNRKFGDVMDGWRSFYCVLSQSWSRFGVFDKFIFNDWFYIKFYWRQHEAFSKLDIFSRFPVPLNSGTDFSFSSEAQK